MTTFEGPKLSETPGIGALTLGGFLDEVVERFGEHEALVLDDPLRGGTTVRWRYRELQDRARQIGRALIATGVEPGDTVGVLMGNRPEAVAAIFGAALAGAVVAPMSTFATTDDIVDMITRSRAGVVLTQRELRGRPLGDEVATIQQHVERLHCAAVGTPAWTAWLTRGDAIDPERLVERAARIQPDDPALIIFTSGTTSRPKAILHAHRAPAAQSWVQAGIFGRHDATRMFSALPLFWTAGFNTAMGATLAAGACWVMQEVFDASSALELMARERVTEPYTLPHQTAAIAELPGWAETDLSALRCVFGKSAYARHPKVDGDTGWIMPVGYGLSETCAFVASHRCDTSREAARHGYGTVVPGARLRILDPDTRRPLGRGERGEIAVGGVALMIGYLDGPGDAIDADGFFHTGDLGFVDDDGVVHFEGRTSEMIKTAGANVSPAEIEVQLRRLREVKLSRIVGVPDERLGEIVVACVVPVDGATLDAEGVRSFLRGRVAAYKVPRRVLFFDERDMPMTGSDTKVRDAALVDLVMQRLSAEPSTTGGR